MVRHVCVNRIVSNHSSPSAAGAKAQMALKRTAQTRASRSRTASAAVGRPARIILDLEWLMKESLCLLTVHGYGTN